jgi:hypothetical protein
MADAAYRVALWTILVGAYLRTGVDLPRDRGAARVATRASGRRARDNPTRRGLCRGVARPLLGRLPDDGSA